MLDVTRRGRRRVARRAPCFGSDGEDTDGARAAALPRLERPRRRLRRARRGRRGRTSSTARRLRLVRLARPAPPQLQRLAARRRAARDPGGRARPLRRRALPRAAPASRRSSSSDGSFTPPEISAPSLMLRASYGAGHALELGWAWAYRVGAETRQAPLGGQRPGRASAISTPSARSSPGPRSPGPASSASGCSTAPGGRRTRPRSRWADSTACASRPRSCRGCGACRHRRRGRGRAARLPRRRRLARRSASRPPRSPASATGSTSA